MWSLTAAAVTSPLRPRLRPPPLSRLNPPTSFLTLTLTQTQIKTLNLQCCPLLTVRATSDGVSIAPAIAPPPKTKEYSQWDSLTSKFAGAANFPFLFLQIPQITLNAHNLLLGNKSALSAVPWLGMLTGLLGNLSLLSYFTKKKEPEAILVQTLGVVSTYIVLSQLTLAQSMPLPHFLSTTAVVILGLTLNFLNYFGSLNEKIWKTWEDVVTIGGLSVLPQVIWSTFVPRNNMLPGIIACTAATAAVVMAGRGKLNKEGEEIVGCMCGWSATFLFMSMPIAQMWTNFMKPENVKGLSGLTMVLSMMGNGLMIPRALFVRDLMWFTGSAWAAFLHGLGNLVCMYCSGCIGREFILAVTIGFSLWIGFVLWQDGIANGNGSPAASLKELIFGR